MLQDGRSDGLLMYRTFSLHSDWTLAQIRSPLLLSPRALTCVLRRLRAGAVYTNGASCQTTTRIIPDEVGAKIARAGEPP